MEARTALADATVQEPMGLLWYLTLTLTLTLDFSDKDLRSFS